MTRFTLCSRASMLTLAAGLAGVGCGDTSPTAPEAGVAANVGVAKGWEADGSEAGGSKLGESKVAGELVVLDARETICKFTPVNNRTVNGTLHFSGYMVETQVRSDDARYNGKSTIELRGHREVATGDGSGFGRFTTRPATIDGTWEGKFTGRWAGGLFTGTSVAHGTGALQGQVLHGTLREIPADPATTPCVPIVGTQFIETIRIHAPPGLAK